MGRRRAGRVASGLAVAFLLLDAGMKLARAAPALDATADLGFAPALAPVLGGVLLACVLVHVVPRTSALGAVLLTGYLGGAVAAHVRVENPLLTHVLFPVYLGVLLWAGLLLRDTDLRRALLTP